MQTLGVNTIRVYNVDPTLNHDDCVSIFNAVGIYMLLDVNSPLPNQSLDPGNLQTSYSSTYLEHIFGVVEAFKNYPNLLGFFGGNEVMNTPDTGGTVPPYLRAVTRDLKDYISKHADRNIPVGYSAADVDTILEDSWSYLSCNNGDDSRSDFFGLNSYSWCGPLSPTANFQASGYDKLISMFGNTSIPIFFSEYGCNKVEPRVFDEVPVIYGPNMTNVLSGGLVYEYYEETSNNYGLVWLYDNGTAQLRSDYDALQGQLNKLDVQSLQSGNMSATSIQSPKCDSSLIHESTVNTSFTLPSIPSGGQSLIDNGISNPNNGKIVDVSSNNVALPVYSSNGGTLQNLAIKPLSDDQSNTPNGDNTSGGASTSPAPSSTPTSSSTQPSATKKSASNRVEIRTTALVGLVGISLFLYVLRDFIFSWSVRMA